MVILTTLCSLQRQRITKNVPVSTYVRTHRTTSAHSRCLLSRFFRQSCGLGAKYNKGITYTTHVCLSVCLTDGLVKSLPLYVRRYVRTPTTTYLPLLLISSDEIFKQVSAATPVLLLLLTGQYAATLSLSLPPSLHSPAYFSVRLLATIPGKV